MHHQNRGDARLVYRKFLQTILLVKLVSRVRTFYNDKLQPYFCGQSDECMIVGSKLALDRAKANINRWFPVVAVLERMTQSLRVLEYFLPKFFSGASRVYSQDLKGEYEMISLTILGSWLFSIPSVIQNLTETEDLEDWACPRAPEQSWQRILPWNTTSTPLRTAD